MNKGENGIYLTVTNNHLRNIKVPNSVNSAHFISKSFPIPSFFYDKNLKYCFNHAMSYFIEDIKVFALNSDFL